MLNIRNAEDKLFDQWDKRIRRFCRDGIVDVDSYLKSPIKIILALRESHEYADDMRQYIIEQCNNDKTTPTAARWVQAIFQSAASVDEQEKWSQLKRLTLENRKSLLRSICWMNVKKETGGASVDSKFDYLSSLEGELFAQQLELYLQDPEIRPRVIICCGTFNPFYAKMKGRMEPLVKTSEDVLYRKLDGKIPVIGFRHPNRAPIREAARLARAVSEILKCDECAHNEE